MAKTRGFVWVGPSVTNANTKTGWRCKNDHEWEAVYGGVYGGKGCPTCRKNRDLTITHFDQAGSDRRIQWVRSAILPRSHDLTLWKCKAGHQWKASYSNISRGRNCRTCIGRKIATTEDYNSYATSRGFSCIAQGRTNHAKTTWACPKGHQWRASYTQLTHTGSGCPFCVDMINGVAVSKPQREISRLVKGELNYPAGRYRIDVALLDKKIAIEYDCWYWHRHTQIADAQRAEKLIALGWLLLRIKSREAIPTITQIQAALNHLTKALPYCELVLSDWREVAA